MVLSESFEKIRQFFLEPILTVGSRRFHFFKRAITA